MRKRSSNPLFRIRLANLIQALGITDQRFAHLCGITQAAVSQILSGKRQPSLETLDRIHMATGASIDYLIGYKLGLEPNPKEKATK